MDNEVGQDNAAPQAEEAPGKSEPAAEEFDAAIKIEPGRKIHLAKISPDSKAGTSKDAAEKKIEKLRLKLGELQEALYAERRRSLLIIVQATDTGGKDGLIRNLCAGMDPSSFQVTNFKYPTPEELEHDFLWRIHKATPRRGIVAMWNRSHYEDVLVPRVHRQITAKVCRERYDQINAFENLVHSSQITIVKFFLHISKEEQKERLEDRLKDPLKHWKFNPGDLKERERWDDYQRAYENMINHCSTETAPWFVIPANRKWARNLMSLQVVLGILEEMNPQHPRPSFNPEKIVVT